MKSTGLYTLQVSTDCLVMFAHPNGKVVPLADTTPMTSNINHNDPPASPLRLRATARRASWSY
jgi:hypothetical protein